MILRLILIILVIWLAYSVIQYVKKLGQKSSPAKIDPTTMVKCKLCATHVPSTDAVYNESGAYCSPEHAEQSRHH